MPKHDLFSLHFSVLTMNNFVSIILNFTQTLLYSIVNQISVFNLVSFISGMKKTV